MRKLLLSFVLLQGISSGQSTGWEKDATPLHRAQKALTSVIVHDIFSPPVAGRIYAYANMAAYEVLAMQDQSYHSLHGQVKTFPAVSPAAGKICYSVAALQAFFNTGKSLVFSEAILQDSANRILSWYKKKLSSKEFAASVLYGERVAATVIQWAGLDKYRETRSLRRYNYLKQDGKWLPTPPVYMAAVEPYWNRIRLLVLDSCTQFRAELPPAFSKEQNSAFYEQAKEVYEITRGLSAQQKAVASFWDCNPFAVTTEGHLNFASKKISPGGHWISIAGIACRGREADILRSAAVYTFTAIALFDAFIICWDEKYRSNVIRPESYINRYIDENWRPLLQTPPFPEYTSGHSVISAVAAGVLTSLLGSQSFDDDTEVEFGLPVKHFGSFTAAAEEAAVSRLYGGIHYRAAIESGRVQGTRLSNWLLGKIRLME